MRLRKRDVWARGHRADPPPPPPAVGTWHAVRAAARAAAAGRAGGDRWAQCTLRPGPLVLLPGASGPLGGRTLLVIALGGAGGKSYVSPDCEAWRAHYHTVTLRV